MYRHYPIVVLAVATLFILHTAVDASQPADWTGARDRATETTFAGRVLDSHGRPVPGAKVTFYRMTDTETVSLPKIEIIEEENTDRNGGFDLTVTQRAGSYRPDYAVARKEGFALGWVMCRTHTDHGYDIVLGEPRGLAGNVVDTTGQPIADAEVGIARAMMGEDEDWRILELPSFLDTKTDKNGRFLFADMPAEATFELRAQNGSGHSRYPHAASLR